MKLVVAYIRVSMAGAALEALLERGCPAVSVTEVQGVTPGLLRESYDFSVRLSQPVERVAKLEIVAADADVEHWTDAIAGAARTGAEGDGILFVLPVEEVRRIRTGVRGVAALAPRPPRGGRDP
ncbi:MAG: P-II family nitrogen regulator [Gemmatimonadota bacterium]